MQAYVLNRAEGIDGAALTEVPLPKPTAGEVRVRLHAAGLNHRELWILRGLYPGMVLPCILGADGAGIVDAVGEGADPALLGRAVVVYPAREWGDDPRFPGARFHLLGMPAPGTFADAICVDAAAVEAVPAHLDMAQAAALPTAALTAWRGLSVKAALRAGETLLVTGVGGGVGGFALQFGVAMGAQVL
jgi:zinc-binding alcohol dehydrogenase/oxidoreductase